MNRILADRGMSKTSTLLNQANWLAGKNPCDEVLFVSQKKNMKAIAHQKCKEVARNIKFLTYEEYNRFYIPGQPKSKYTIIDDIDKYLETLNVVAYSMSLADSLPNI